MRSVTIVIPSYNRPEKLRDCLSALARLDAGPYDTVVVDDGGDIPLGPICAEFAPWARVVFQTNAGPAAARNTGAAASDAEFLCFTDDDCKPKSDWVVRMLAAHAKTPNRLVGGLTENAVRKNVYSQTSQSLCSYLYDYYAASGSEMSFFTSNNMCCYRADFLKIGGFDETFSIAASEDRDFGLRWKDNGGHLTYEPSAIINHAHDLDFRSFWKQHENYGLGARRLHLTMDNRGDNRPKIEPIKFYTGMLTYPLRRTGYRRFMQSLLLGISQVAMVAGYFRAARQKPDIKIKQVPGL